MKQIVLIMMMLLPILAFSQSKQSDEYYNKGVELYNKGKFKEAIPYFEKSNELDEKELEEGDERRYYSIHWLANCYYKLGNKLKAEELDSDGYFIPVVDRRLTVEADRYSEIAMSLITRDYETAIDYFEEAIKIKKEVAGQMHPCLAKDYNWLGYCQSNLGEHESAEKNFKMSVNICKQTYGDYSIQYADALKNYSWFLMNSGKMEDAIDAGTRTVVIQRKIYGNDYTTLADNLHSMASLLYEGEAYDKAVQQEIVASGIYKNILGDDNPKYITSLNNLFVFCVYDRNFAEAIKAGEKLVEAQKKTSGENNPDYITNLIYLAMCHNNVGNYSEAIRHRMRAAELQKESLGETHPDYIESLSEVAEYNLRDENYPAAISFGIKAAELQKKNSGENNAEYAKLLKRLDRYYCESGNFDVALIYATKSMEIRKKLSGELDLDYATSMNDVACCKANLGDYTEAIKYGMKVLDIRKQKLGEEHRDYASALQNLASYYSGIGNDIKAIELVTTAADIYKKVSGEYSEDDFYCLNNLAQYNSNIGNNSIALVYGLKAGQISKEIYGEDHPRYANVLCNLASYTAELEKYTTSIKLQTKALEIQKEKLGEAHPSYAWGLNNLASYNARIGNFDEAIKLGELSAELQKKNLGENHPKYTLALENLALYYMSTKNYEKSSELFSKCYNLTETYVLKNFAMMTSRERATFWNTKYRSLFQSTFPFAAYKYSSPTQRTLAYKGLLLSKGLLLNAELEIYNLIEKSGNKQLAYRYDKIRSDRRKLDSLYSIQKEKHTMNADSLSKVIEREEKLLVESSKELGDYTKSLSIDWKDVQKKLTDKDIAIEFADFYDYDEKKQTYIALILKKGMSAPEIIKLFDKDDFNSVDTSEYYKTNKLYNIVWKPLQKYLQGVENVYFSPSGQFHVIGIEYLPTGSGNEIFSNKYKLHRLSSTRELALEKTQNPNKKAAVYGGIRYDFSAGQWSELKNKNVNFEHKFRDVPIITGGEAYYLEGSKIEAENIANALRAAQYIVSTKFDYAATEESFKKLSGSGIRILHIGTHGFYQTDDSLGKNFSSLLTNDDRMKEDNSLSQSGLLLAGANTALDPEKRKDIPDGVEDGILTAKEISRLDFKGLDLVVLSACETGLGEITGDGVFGLQRGFKKAGAQTIIMSLWKVADDATQLLMTEFFKNLTLGKSKRESFISAQNSVRAKYSDPIFWAAFIMVDDI